MDLQALSLLITESGCPYLKLGLHPGSCSPEDIERAYKQRSKLLHPDKWRDPRANEVFCKLRSAYDEALRQQLQGTSRPQLGHAGSNTGVGRRCSNKWQSFTEEAENEIPVMVGSFWQAPGLAQVKSIAKPSPPPLRRTAPLGRSDLNKAPPPPLRRTAPLGRSDLNKAPPPPHPQYRAFQAHVAPFNRQQQQQQQQVERSGDSQTTESSSGSESSSNSLSCSSEEEPAAAAPQHVLAYKVPGLRRPGNDFAGSAPTANSLDQRPLQGPPLHLHTHKQQSPAVATAKPMPKLPEQQGATKRVRHSFDGVTMPKDGRSALQLLQELHRPALQPSPAPALSHVLPAVAGVKDRCSQVLGSGGASTVHEQAAPSSHAQPKSPLLSSVPHRKPRRLRPCVPPESGQPALQQQEQEQQQGEDVIQELIDVGLSLRASRQVQQQLSSGVDGPHADIKQVQQQQQQQQQQQLDKLQQQQQQQQQLDKLQQQEQLQGRKLSSDGSMQAGVDQQTGSFEQQQGHLGFNQAQCKLQQRRSQSQQPFLPPAAEVAQGGVLLPQQPSQERRQGEQHQKAHQEEAHEQVQRDAQQQEQKLEKHQHQEAQLQVHQQDVLLQEQKEGKHQGVQQREAQLHAQDEQQHVHKSEAYQEPHQPDLTQEHKDQQQDRVTMQQQQQKQGQQAQEDEEPPATNRHSHTFCASRRRCKVARDAPGNLAKDCHRAATGTSAVADYVPAATADTEQQETVQGKHEWCEQGNLQSTLPHAQPNQHGNHNQARNGQPLTLQELWSRVQPKQQGGEQHTKQNKLLPHVHLKQQAQRQQQQQQQDSLLDLLQHRQKLGQQHQQHSHPPPRSGLQPTSMEELPVNGLHPLQGQLLGLLLCPAAPVQPESLPCRPEPYVKPPPSAATSAASPTAAKSVSVGSQQPANTAPQQPQTAPSTQRSLTAAGKQPAHATSQHPPAAQSKGKQSDPSTSAAAGKQPAHATLQQTPANRPKLSASSPQQLLAATSKGPGKRPLNSGLHHLPPASKPAAQLRLCPPASKGSSPQQQEQQQQKQQTQKQQQQQDALDERLQTGHVKSVVHEGGPSVDALEDCSLEGLPASKRVRRLHNGEDDEEVAKDVESVTLDEEDIIEEVEEGFDYASTVPPTSRRLARVHALPASQRPGAPVDWREQAQRSAASQAQKLAKERISAGRKLFVGRRRGNTAGLSSGSSSQGPPRNGSSRGRGSGNKGSSGRGSRGGGSGSNMQKSLAHFVCKRVTLK